MFISTYANQTTFILYIFILTLFYVWHGICGGGQIIIILQIFISKITKQYEKNKINGGTAPQCN